MRFYHINITRKGNNYGKYEIAVFDVDGTLLDTTEGVLASVKYTIDKMGF